MGDLKDIADVADRLIYEVIALLLPGALFALLLLAVAGPEVLGGDGWNRGLRFASEHGVIAIAIAYAAGYVVQGLSRPVAHRLAATFDWFWRSWESPRRGVVTVAANGRRWIETRILRWPTVSPTSQSRDSGKTVVHLDHLVAKKLADRLELGEGERFSAADLQDLTFSALLPNVKRLERVPRSGRSVLAVSRPVLAVVAAPLFFILGARGRFRVERESVYLVRAWMTLLGLTVAFRALIRRELMYEALWRSILCRRSS